MWIDCNDSAINSSSHQWWISESQTKWEIYGHVRSSTFSLVCDTNNSLGLVLDTFPKLIIKLIIDDTVDIDEINITGCRIAKNFSFAALFDHYKIGNVTMLSLRNNHNLNLSKYAFQSLSMLTNLTLSSNGISELPDNVFAGLMELRMLVLHSNELTDLSDGTFHGLKKLTDLRLSNNSWI